MQGMSFPIMTEMVVPASMLLPMMVMRVPPSIGPTFGVTSVISGSWTEGQKGLRCMDQKG